MIPVPSPIEGVTIEHDASSGRWRLHAGAAAATLRPWTWGERRRLLGASTISGVLDRAVFTRGLFDLLLDGPVSHVEPTSLALVCLYLLGVSESGQVQPLTRAEFLAATTLGWSPQQIDGQPADDIDRLIAQIQPQAKVEVDDGWTHIVIGRDEPSSIEQRLESMLLTIARLAGLIDAVANETGCPVVARDAVAPLAPVPKEEPRRDQPIELTFGGTARLKRRHETSESKAAAAGIPAPSGSDDMRTTATRPPFPEPRIARVASRVEARSQAAVLARTLQPSAALVSEAPAPSHAGGSDSAVRVSLRASPASIASPRPPVPSAEPVAACRQATPAKMAVPAAVVHTARRLETPAMPRQHATASHTEPDLFPTDFFPTFRATLQWPEMSSSIGSSVDSEVRSSNAVLPSAPFQLSDLEERIADVLDRAAREAGIDLP